MKIEITANQSVNTCRSLELEEMLSNFVKILDHENL